MVQLRQQLIGISDAIRAVLDDVDCAARTDAKVLLTGESGVGKEVVAGLIHHRSRRARGPFLAINCAGVPDTLLASELFGHVRGSFTDATSDKRGWLEQANGGTIFMDEVGEMSLQMQALLLRFLESGEIQPVGSDRYRSRVDVRVVTATNRRLHERIEAKEFRDDLFYRLNVFHIDIPPLRERRADISVLVDYFLRQFSNLYSRPVPEVHPDALNQLVSYNWPGNVRELRNAIERLVVRSASAITTDLLPMEIRGAASRGLHLSPEAPSPKPTRGDKLFERIIVHGESFRTVVEQPFLAHDLTREDVRTVVRRGLDLTGGSYKSLLSVFRIQPEDYKKFLSFLSKYDLQLPVSDRRPLHAHLSDPEGAKRASGE